MRRARRAVHLATSRISRKKCASFGLRWLEQLAQDVRFALRSFRRSPAFVVTVVATITLALGLNTTAFTIFNAYVLRPMQVRDPYSLYQVRYYDQRGRWHLNTWDEYQQLRELRPGAESFAYHHLFSRVDGLPMFGALTTGETFQVPSAPVELGRALLPEDATPPNGSPVMVLAYDARRSRFGADSGVIGRQVLVRGQRLTVVGVLSKRFQGISAVPPDFWAPITLVDLLEGPGLLGANQSELLRVVVRLEPKETETRAEAQLGTWATRATAARPDSLRATSAAVLGFVLSRWMVDVGVRVMFASVPGNLSPYLRVIPLAPDVRVFGFGLVVTLVAALLFGLIPALQATRPSIVQASRGDFDTAFRPGRMRATLLIAQISVCALLLITTGVLLRGARSAGHAETGISTDNVVHVLLDERTRDMARRLLESHPLVADIAGSSASPLDGYFPTLAARADASQRDEQVAYNFVSDRYFAVLGIRIGRGRAFTEAESRAGEQVAVVSESFARRVLPGVDPIGHVVRVTSDVPSGGDLDHVRTARVIGVASNAVSGWIGTGLERPVIYYPKPLTAGGMRMLARVRGNEEQARLRIDQDVQSSLATSPLDEIHTLNDFLSAQIYPFRAFSWVSSALGSIALLLTLAGIYGVLSYLVTQRTREIGIRMALGATTQSVVTMVLKQSLVLAGIGIAMGTALALAASRLFESVLVIVDTFDIVGYASGAGVVLAAALLASFAPARRAASVDPLAALREE